MPFDYNNMVSSYRDIDNSIINPWDYNKVKQGFNSPNYTDITSLGASSYVPVSTLTKDALNTPTGAFNILKYGKNSWWGQQALKYKNDLNANSAEALDKAIDSSLGPNIWSDFGTRIYDNIMKDPIGTGFNIWSTISNYRNQKKALDLAMEQVDLEKEQYYDQKAKRDEMFNNYRMNYAGHRL